MVVVRERNLKRTRSSQYSPEYASRDILHRPCPALGWSAGAIRFRVFLYGLLVLMLPSEGIFFVAANAASAGYCIGYRGILSRGLAHWYVRIGLS